MVVVAVPRFEPEAANVWPLSILWRNVISFGFFTRIDYHAIIWDEKKFNVNWIEHRGFLIHDATTTVYFEEIFKNVGWSLDIEDLTFLENLPKYVIMLALSKKKFHCCVGMKINLYFLFYALDKYLIICSMLSRFNLEIKNEWHSRGSHNPLHLLNKHIFKNSFFGDLTSKPLPSFCQSY